MGGEEGERRCEEKKMVCGLRGVIARLVFLDGGAQPVKEKGKERRGGEENACDLATCGEERKRQLG